MILVDSSVWINYFNGAITPETDALDRLLGSDLVLIGDLILVEVLQGFRDDRDFERARTFLEAFEVRDLGGVAVALASTMSYRALRRRRVTVRKTIDIMIASYCLLHGLPLLHADRDFDILESQLGLKIIR